MNGSTGSPRGTQAVLRRGKFASVRDFAPADRTDLRGSNSNYCRGVSIESREFNFNSVTALVHVDHGPYVAALKTFFRQRSYQHDTFKFLDRRDSSVLAWVRGHEPRDASPRSMIQTVLSMRSDEFPACAGSAPSPTNFSPYADSIPSTSSPLSAT